jgi:hypothetical protein
VGLPAATACPAPAFDPCLDYPVPDRAACEGFLDAHAVPAHIREHSAMVAMVAGEIAEMAVAAEVFGLDSESGRRLVAAVTASALLHDLAKGHSIEHGGNHAQLGGAWVQALTGNPAIAQGVTHHVWWPWDTDPVRHFLPLAVLYGDKRVQHTRVVSLGARYADLAERYGTTAERRARVSLSLSQARAVELTLGELLGVKLDACAFDRRRLVS